MIKKVTITDLAKRANVSVTTVSQILNGKEERFSDKTVERVKGLQKEMGYVPDFNAQSLIRRSGKTIGVLVPNLNNPFFAEFNRGIEAYGMSEGYTPLIFGSDDSPKIAGHYMLEAIRRAADGMIIASAVEDVKQIDHMLQQNGLPYLLIDRSRPEKGDEVDMQNEQGGQMVADYLHQMGHQKVAVVITEELTLNLEHRLAGFLERMKELEIPVPEDLIFTTELSKQGGVAISAAIWKAKPTVVFAINDEIAIGLNRGFKDLGLKVPEDISIMGYDNIDMAEYMIPALTTINQPAFEMGETAAKLIIDRIKNHHEAPQHVTLPINLVERESVRKIK